jgi:hypothetical protein
MEVAKTNLADRRTEFAEFLAHASELKQPRLRRTMISASLIQLYSAVESTMMLILDDVAKNASAHNPVNFTTKLRREWLRVAASTDEVLNTRNRLDRCEAAIATIVSGKQTGEFQIAKGGGGNWTDKTIEDMSTRLGIQLSVSPDLQTRVKSFVRDNMGPLEFVKSQRNKLSHGNLSFSEAAQNLTCQDVKAMGETAFEYLDNVILCSERYLAAHAFVTVAS